ncbi:MAG: UvrD-helicase domain-containing protein, partial [Deltaproteobacteria bacterium]|nr:UvrD-helicase domain-containing protein [Deltaproteobacteria bacterium]
MPYLKNLNPTQREAVTHDSGPLLILAGAGSGKTRVLTTRIAHLIRDKGVAPENILAVTFTNKASKEMRVRLKALIGDKAKHLWLGTFHSLGLRMLKEHTHLLGKGSHITVYDNDDQLRLVKSVMDTLNISIKATSPKAILNRINQAKNEDIAPSDYLEFHSDFFSKRVSDIYTIYQKKLAEMSALDFG